MLMLSLLLYYFTTLPACLHNLYLPNEADITPTLGAFS